MKKTATDQESKESNSRTIPLSMVKMGKTVRLVSIDAGKKLTHRLTELGLTPGVELMIVHDSGGPVLLSVRDSRVALGRSMASKLNVAAIS